MSTSPDADLLEAELPARVERARGLWDEAVWRLQLGEPEEGLAAIRRGLPSVPEQDKSTVPLAYAALVALQIAVAARRLGIPLSVDERYSSWPVCRGWPPAVRSARTRSLERSGLTAPTVPGQRRYRRPQAHGRTGQASIPSS